MRAKEGILGGQPGFEQIGSPGDRDSSTGDISEQSGNNSSNLPSRSGQSGDYTLDTLPNGVLSGDTSETGGPMTAAERARVLDEELRKGYETFGGFILSERESAERKQRCRECPAGCRRWWGSSQYQPQTMQETAGDPSAVQETLLLRPLEEKQLRPFRLRMTYQAEEMMMWWPDS